MELESSGLPSPVKTHLCAGEGLSVIVQDLPGEFMVGYLEQRGPGIEISELRPSGLSLKTGRAITFGRHGFEVTPSAGQGFDFDVTLVIGPGPELG